MKASNVCSPSSKGKENPMNVVAGFGALAGIVISAVCSTPSDERTITVYVSSSESCSLLMPHSFDKLQS